jgi:hypothetical protein
MMHTSCWRAALLPVRTVMSPGAAMHEARIRSDPLVLASMVLLVAALGSLGLPRLLDLLGATLAPSGQALLDSHLGVMRAALARLVIADRVLPPLPYVIGGLIVVAVAAPVLSGHGVRGRAVVTVLAVGAAPLLVQRVGELAVVWLAPGDGLVAGDVARLPARFNIGVAGVLAAVGVTASGAWSVVAEAANAVGLWVIVLWGWGLASLERSAPAAARGAALRAWPFWLAAAAYAAGYALYAALFPLYLLLVMGAP